MFDIVSKTSKNNISVFYSQIPYQFPSLVIVVIVSKINKLKIIWIEIKLQIKLSK